MINSGINRDFCSKNDGGSGALVPVRSGRLVRRLVANPEEADRNDDIFLNDYMRIRGYFMPAGGVSLRLRDSPAARDSPHLFHDLPLNIYNVSIPGYGRAVS